MGQSRRFEACVAAGAVLLVGVLGSALAACGCMSIPAFPPPPTVLPTWPSGADPGPAISYPAQTATTEGLQAGSDGWRFKPTVDIEVSALGFYDDGQDGLSSPHRVAILRTADDRAVAETTVQSSSLLDGVFRWEPVGPVVLEAGREYVLVWDSPAPGDPEVVDPKEASLAFEVRCLGCGATAEAGPPWGYHETGVKNVILSGNFKYRPVAPEG